MSERTPIYNDAHDKRVISSHNGLFTPQRRVSHTPGCNRDWRWVQVDKDYGYRERTYNVSHSDPWHNIHAPCDKKNAMMTVFGPERTVNPTV